VSKPSDRREKLIARLQLLGEQESTETAMFHQAAAASYGLGITDMKALQIVLREGPQTAGQLATPLRLTTGAVTSVLDRLERQSLIIRSQHPEDRRKIIVSANTKTLTDGDNVYRSIGDAYAAMQRGFTTPELEFLVRYYEGSIEVTRREIARLGESADRRRSQARRSR
jgi:MarR family transcriptional regulator, organic hydroperoxide resistance regulator